MSLYVPQNSPQADGKLYWLTEELRLNAWLYSCMLLFVVGTWTAAQAASQDFWPFFMTYGIRVAKSVPVLLCAGFLTVSVRALLRSKAYSPLQSMRADLRFLDTSPVVLRYVFATACLALFMAAFLYNKMLIPEIAPFQWDETFATWDRWLLGDDAWRVLHPLLGFPIVTRALDILYSIWAPLVFIFWGGFFASPRISRELRTRYWASTVLAWTLLGLLFATVFSAAGPCYYGAITGLPSPYRELEIYLAQISSPYPLSASVAKNYLWAIHTGQWDAPGGISAMPSIHNAQAALFAVAAYAVNRRFGHIMLAYAVAIFLGSIHLGWHYAVDGILGVAGALLIWFLVGAARKRPPAEAR